jgi:hypothetical protein
LTGFLGPGGLLETNEFDIHFQLIEQGRPVVSMFLLMAPLLGVVHASSPDDATHIKAMAGCFEVTFQYADTKVMSSEYTSKPAKRSQAIEWVVVDIDQPERIELQHVLVSGPAMIKHWRQIWVYEGTDVTEYRGLERHALVRLDAEAVAGRWTQVVTNVDDAPRYGCTGEWSTQAKEPEWACTVDAPLPRREKENRHEYDILTRTNIHRIVSDGWDHDQRNVKVRLDGDTRRPLAREFGHNTYRRVDDAQCAEAVAWWPGAQPHWAEIRGAWETVLGEATPEGRVVRVDEKKGITPLWVDLFWLARRAEKRARSAENTRSRSVALIEGHVEPVADEAAE